MSRSKTESTFGMAVHENGLARFLEGRLVASIGMMTGAIVLAVPTWLLLSPAVAWTFLAAMLALATVTFSIKRWISQMPRAPSSFARRSALTAANNALIGGGLAAATIWLYWLGGEPMFIYAVTVQAGIAAASLGLAAYHPPAMYSFLLFGLGSFLLSLLFVPSTLSEQIIGAGTTFALIYLLVTGRQQAGVLRSAIRLQHENDDLLVRLAREKEEADAARREAEEASLEKSRFFASASHDLRQPVHALNLYAPLLREPASDAERDEVLERITTCVATLDNLFESLLTVTRAESRDADDMPLVSVALQTVMATVVDQFSAQAEEKNLDLRFVPSSVWVRGESLTLERIVSNLVANAIAFTPGGKVLVGVRRRGDQAELQVLDSGIGITAEEQKRIFSEFYQVDNPGRPSGTGFGLGLVIVQRLCRALRYQISVRSQPRRGSCFSVGLPRCAPVPAADQLEPTPPAWGLKRDVHVLLVDDDENVRDAMARMLAGWQVNAKICASSAEALDYARQHGDKLDCLLLDQRLGESIDGLQLAKLLLALLHRPVPVAIITGEADGDWLDQANACGYTVLFKPTKPLRLRALLIAIGKESAVV